MMCQNMQCPNIATMLSFRPNVIPNLKALYRKMHPAIPNENSYISQSTFLPQPVKISFWYCHGYSSAAKLKKCPSKCHNRQGHRQLSAGAGVYNLDCPPVKEYCPQYIEGSHQCTQS